MSNDSDASLAGADIGVGGWLTPHLALTGRISGVDIKNGDANANGTVISAFVGPSLQYWIDPHFWVGGGAGLATVRSTASSCTGTNTSSDCGVNGFGLDFRAGYSFNSDSAHTFNVSVEVTPGFYSLDNGMGGNDSLSATGISFLAGYQYL